jgi:phosphoribosyl 1,2-cyclic phosphodiesterase
MKLKVLNSRSEGNCYILENETSALVIEAGVPFKEVKKALDFDISKIVGCLITHEHGDHSKYVNEFLKAGVTVWLSAGTNSKLIYNSILPLLTEHKHKFLPLLTEHKHKFRVGNFTIISFNVIHDAAEPLGFLINHSETGNILFLTDTHYSPFIFPDLSHILIECNYSQAILDDNILNDKIPMIVRNRIMESHISLETCKEILSINDLSKVQNIVLLHLSDGNSNAKQFKEEIQELTGKQVFIAEKELEINLNINAF